MADRPYWQQMTDYIYNPVDNDLNTQEEIDSRIEDALSIFDHFTFDQDEIGAEFKGRTTTFENPIDLIRWVEEAGIPEGCIQVWAYDGGEDVEYHVYVSDDTPGP